MIVNYSLDFFYIIIFFNYHNNNADYFLKIKNNSPTVILRLFVQTLKVARPQFPPNNIGSQMNSPVARSRFPFLLNVLCFESKIKENEILGITIINCPKCDPSM